MTKTVNMKIQNFTIKIIAVSILLFSGFAVNAQDDVDAIPNNKERKGPQNIHVFEILRNIQSDYEFESDYDIINVNRKIYRDANPKSGYFYYLPTEYNLNWTIENGFAFHVCRLNGESRESVITAELKPNITRKDLEVAEVLLKADLIDETYKNFRDLLSMPLDGSPSISIPQLTNYGVDANDITITVPTDFLDPIIISWKMRDVGNMLTAIFNNLGINGNITLQPAGDMPEFKIPLKIKLDHNKTFGTFNLTPSQWRNKKWENPTPYPVILKNMHILRIKKQGGVSQSNIYTWNMGNQRIEPKGSLTFDATTVPKWIDTDKTIKKIWMEYSVKSCKDCSSKIRQEIQCVAPDEDLKITYYSNSALSSVNASTIRIETKSIQADPQRVRKMKLRTIALESDSDQKSAGELRLMDDEQMDFEYKIQLVMSDGRVLNSNKWNRSVGKSDIFISEKMLKSLFPNL